MPRPFGRCSWVGRRCGAASRVRTRGSHPMPALVRRWLGSGTRLCIGLQGCEAVAPPGLPPRRDSTRPVPAPPLDEASSETRERAVQTVSLPFAQAPNDEETSSEPSSMRSGQAHRARFQAVGCRQSTRRRTAPELYSSARPTTSLDPQSFAPSLRFFLLHPPSCRDLVRAPHGPYLPCAWIWPHGQDLKNLSTGSRHNPD